MHTIYHMILKTHQICRNFICGEKNIQFKYLYSCKMMDPSLQNDFMQLATLKEENIVAIKPKLQSKYFSISNKKPCHFLLQQKVRKKCQMLFSLLPCSNSNYDNTHIQFWTVYNKQVNRVQMSSLSVFCVKQILKCFLLFYALSSATLLKLKNGGKILAAC